MKIVKVILRAKDWNIIMLLATVYFMLGTATGIILTPFLTKLTAHEISAAGLATWAVIKGAQAYVLPYIEHITLKESFSLARYIEVANIVLIPVYIAFPEYGKTFILLWWGIGLAGGILWGIMGIKYDEYLSEQKELSFSEIQVTERLLYTTVSTVVGIVAIGIYMFDITMLPLAIVCVIKFTEIIVLNKIIRHL